MVRKNRYSKIVVKFCELLSDIKEFFGTPQADLPTNEATIFNIPEIILLQSKSQEFALT